MGTALTLLCFSETSHLYSITITVKCPNKYHMTNVLHLQKHIHKWQKNENECWVIFLIPDPHVMTVWS